MQDVASRGLGLVYELSETQNQSDLAQSLLQQLLGGKRQVNQVNEDTKLFEEGVLGKTPTGWVVFIISPLSIESFYFFGTIIIYNNHLQLLRLYNRLPYFKIHFFCLQKFIVGILQLIRNCAL